MKALVLILALLSFSLPALGSYMPDGQVCDQKGANALSDNTVFDGSSYSGNNGDELQ